ncbi:N-acetylmuramyl-L-alanine amidase, negative regulator of AmpC, AmpD [Magnetococcus marinus MC-1]|uniref:1,6-anhydro-N-acetylmuramyl-L-alanine amidase AmpD n=1 Tax=Magnetococcus marinus (strain ATCC BAA-1437 / JCM 17883 / MC-1) TaxID=156889 RepID=A0L5K2_MAGMM|nr:1,6-anhydro-N-acetylmuramyl-L-alanine amidase AmpD [Magnetococcus marinus]ABK43245.1 N-acetylmuramyl-L-alanine amidase, negative regulator of AmpC, AmpD [Magnetococcus marinus MC-1]
MTSLFRYLPSPHCDERPVGEVVELLVVHAISLPPGQFGGGWIDDLFMGVLDAQADPYFVGIASLRVAAHFLIGRDGGITQYVPLSKRGWHAGESVWQGRPRCNDFSIGVELEGDEEHPFAAIQYQRLAQLTRTLQQRLPRLVEVVGHQDIAPGRKWDPGRQFDWPRFRAMLPHVEPLDLPIIA